MAATDTFKPKRVQELLYWIFQRERIRRQKEAGLPPPWSNDPIMANTRWCNIRRMDDKVSRWLVDNWYPNSTHGITRGQMLAAAGLARLINWPESLQGLLTVKTGYRKWDRAEATAHFKAVKAAGGKVFTGCYIINGASGGDKIDQVMTQVDTLFKHPEYLKQSSMEDSWRSMQEVTGIGTFIAGQMVADLRHVWPGEWKDRHTWAPLGPGSRRGMAWLLGWNGTDDLTKMSQAEFEERIRNLFSLLKEDNGFMMVHQDRKLELHDIQNGLCEFDKMMRLKTKTGHARNGYTPTNLKEEV